MNIFCWEERERERDVKYSTNPRHLKFVVFIFFILYPPPHNMFNLTLKSNDGFYFKIIYIKKKNECVRYLYIIQTCDLSIHTHTHRLFFLFGYIILLNKCCSSSWYFIYSLHGIMKKKNIFSNSLFFYLFFLSLLFWPSELMCIYNFRWKLRGRYIIYSK